MRKAMIPPLLALALCACQSQNPPRPTFTISLEPAVLDLRVTETGRVKVHVNRSGDFVGTIAVGLAGKVSGLEVAPLTIDGDAGDLSIRVTDEAEVGTSFATVRAASGDVTRQETLTLHIAKAVASTAAVTIENNGGSKQVPQGRGSVVLEVAGGNLDRVRAVALGDLATTILPGRMPDRLELQAAVPHGATLGAKDLILTTDGGDTTFETALVVTPITAGPEGSDETGTATLDAPLETLAQALALAEAGDTILLLNGTYSEASGESWPQLDGGEASPGPNVPAGVKVTGESATGVLLQGPGKSSTAIGLAFAGDGGAAALHLQGFGQGIRVDAGTVTLSDVVAESNGVGVRVEGGLAKVEGGEYMDSDSGLVATGDSLLELTATSSHDNAGNGVLLCCGVPTLQADGFDAHHNGDAGVHLQDDAQAELAHSSLHQNATYGVSAEGQANLELHSSDLYGNIQGGLWFGARSLVVRDTVIRENAEFGAYVLNEPEKIDFGSFLEAGGNDLHGNGPGGNGDQLLDVRNEKDLLGTVVFTIRSTTFNGVAPKPDIYPPDGRWPYLNSPYFSILNQKNVIQVFPTPAE